MAAPLACIFVGKCREAALRAAAELYGQKLSRLARCAVEVVKDAPAALPPQEKSEREGAAILGRLDARRTPVALDEAGGLWSSRDLAARIRGWTDSGRPPCFIVGGPFGLSPAVRERARRSGALFSLGRITLPHELARVVLLEQLYRAVSIIRGLPYHHD